jgi:hypothetical protein
MGTLSSINTCFTVPTLPSDATPSQSLQFEEKLMIFQEEFDGGKTAISTIGDANSSSANTKPQAQ